MLRMLPGDVEREGPCAPERVTGSDLRGREIGVAIRVFVVCSIDFGRIRWCRQCGGECGGRLSAFHRVGWTAKRGLACGSRSALRQPANSVDAAFLKAGSIAITHHRSLETTTRQLMIHTANASGGVAPFADLRPIAKRGPETSSLGELKDLRNAPAGTEPVGSSEISRHLPGVVIDRLVARPDEWIAFDPEVRGKFDSKFGMLRFWVGASCDVVNFSREGALLHGGGQSLQKVARISAGLAGGSRSPEHLKGSNGLRAWIDTSASNVHRAGSLDFLGPEDIIPPEALANKVRDRDYVLLLHRTEPRHVSSIRRDGLRSFADLAGSKDATPSMIERFDRLKQARVFTNDPSLVYFRPLVAGSPWKVEPDDFVIAVDLGAAFAYHSAFRITATSMSDASYRASRVHVSDLMDQGSVNVTQGAGARSGASGYGVASSYVPECCVRIGRIPPQQFVPHDHLALRGER